MTDLEKFLLLYNELGIILVAQVNEHRQKDDDWYQCLHLQEEDNDKFIGYIGFYSDIYFDKNGKFINQGFWE